ncbi:hypothetical protein RJ640_023106 [Escallonia rubra]|uniref:Glutaminyl-peptide cyclotransferase n=1 Tax=Escallonia rubra TaxID=112253 RepID=A0AA88R7F4_9ASTE|nr:hypothetical protein RJ640_023106 [Escallonia rubra]
MAGASMRKKSNKRSSPDPQQTSMPSPPSSLLSYFSYRYLSLVVSFVLIVCVIVLLSVSSNMWATFGSDAQFDQLYTIEVVNEFPHDPNAFTQGLLYGGNDTLFESTGLQKHSSVRKVALQTGKIESLQKMKDSDFGEGLTLLGKRLFQVTWLEKTGFIYDRNNLSNFKKFTHEMQDGWGLATDGNVLFGSDGTSTLYQLDPQTLKVVRKQVVKYKGHEVHNLNELEYINNEVWANVWQSDCIARISPKDGTVHAWVLLHKLREALLIAGKRDIDVLNGIAWDRDKNRIFVTGKLWPTLYEIKLHPVTKPFHGAIEKICRLMPAHFAKP